MNEALHIASQYLAAAGISFLEKRADDGHTNLGWNSKRQSLDSRALNDDGLLLSLSYLDFSLELIVNDMLVAKLALSKTKHEENIKWLKEVFVDLNLNKEFNFQLHYDLPYENLNDYTFPDLNEESLDERRLGRNNACDVLSGIASEFKLTSEVRTWPHHFDTGLLVELDNGLQIGLGYALPDSMVSDYYHYTSAWNGKFAVPTDGFPNLKVGKWKNGDWNGAILNSDNHEADDIKAFYQEAIEIYRHSKVELKEE